MDKKETIFWMCYLYIFSRMNAQQRFAADAAGAAPELGAIVWLRGVPSAHAGRWRSPAAPLKAGVGPSSALPNHLRESVA